MSWSLLYVTNGGWEEKQIKNEGYMQEFLQIIG